VAWATMVVLPTVGLAQVEVPEGVDQEGVDATEGVDRAEEAVDKVEEEIDKGLPEAFTIDFGDTYDWMRLTSGEWLKGNLKRMRDDEIEFDSDKLDIVTFEWEDVDRLLCPVINTYVFEGKLDLVGRAVVTADTVVVETEDGIQRYPRKDLLSIVEGAPRERNWWSSRLGAGFSATAGNTNQGSFSGYFELERADYRTRTLLRYDGTIGYANKEQNVNRHIGNASARLFISHRWYIYPAAAQFLNDRFQNTRFRATPGAGSGVHLFDTKRWKWDVDWGLGYQYIEFLSAASGVTNPQNDGFVTAGTWAELEFYKDIELELDWRTNLLYTTIGNTNHTAYANFTVEVSDIFDFEVKFTFLRTENPPPRADGTQPQKNDYQLSVGVAFDID
jgi:putative salt-induced outer membrane protein YdiY